MDVPEPKCGPDEVLVRVEACSICGTDRSINDWDPWVQSLVDPPVTVGHELTGTVLEVGQEVERCEEGDTVAVESHVYCDRCDSCRNGARNVCENLSLIGLDVDGGFAEFTTIPKQCVWQVSDRFPAQLRTLLEPLGNSVYATTVEDPSDQDVVVMGCGPTGLFSIAVARASGARNVIGVEPQAYRRNLAKDMGADWVTDGMDPDFPETIRDELGGSGADVVVEMSGHPDAINNGLNLLRSGGRFSFFGLPKKVLEIDVANDVILKGTRFYGIFGREIFRTWEQVMNLLENEEMRPRNVITHEFQLEDFEEAFAIHKDSDVDSGKIVMYP